MTASASVLTVRTTDTAGGLLEVTRPSRYQHISSKTLKKSENHQMICIELEVVRVIQKLIENNVITAEELSRIRAQKLRRRKAAELMEIFYKRDNDNWVAKFLDVIDDSGQGHIIQRLLHNAYSPPFQIPHLRSVQYQERVMFYENDTEDTIRRSYNPEILRIARETLNCDIVTVYEGSVCYLLDPQTDKAISHLLDRNKTALNVRRFLSLLLVKVEKLEKHFSQKRLVTVEITERRNEFLFRINARRKFKRDLKFRRKTPEICNECLRQTVIDNYCSILDEIETPMMEETFRGNDSIIPGCIWKACIEGKMERSRPERAHIFLQLILTNEQLLVDFAAIFRQTSDMIPNIVPCEHQSGQIVPFRQTAKKITLNFVIQYDSTVDAFIVNSVSHGMDRLFKSLGEQISPSSKRYNMLQILERSQAAIENGMRGSDTDQNNFYRMVLSLVIASSVVNKYFGIKVLQQTSFRTFLNTHKHLLYHLLLQRDCCQWDCPLKLKCPQKMPSPNEFECFFKRTGAFQHGENCFCVYSAKQYIDTNALDINFSYSIMKTCGHHLDENDEQKITTITDIRKKVINCYPYVEISKPAFDIHWKTLTTAVLGLASTIDDEYVNTVAGDIWQLRIQIIQAGDISKSITELQDWTRDKSLKIKSWSKIFQNRVQNDIKRGQMYQFIGSQGGKPKELRIVVIGNPSYGKSSVVNLLLNKPQFDSCYSGFVGVKREYFTDDLVNKTFAVTYTPVNVFLAFRRSGLTEHLARCLALTSPGPHAIILEGRHMHVRSNIDDMIESLTKIFGSNILKYVIISIVDEAPSSQTMKSISQYVEKLLRNERIIYVSEESLQLEYRDSLINKLLMLIDQTTETGEKPYFTNTMYNKAEEIITSKMRFVRENQLEKYRQHEKAIATYKSKILFHAMQQQQIRDSDLRDAVLKSEETSCSIL